MGGHRVRGTASKSSMIASTVHTVVHAEDTVDRQAQDPVGAQAGPAQLVPSFSKTLGNIYNTCFTHAVHTGYCTVSLLLVI
eukprot:355571-Chlamydomonas_euryale.AAC.5